MPYFDPSDYTLDQLKAFNAKYGVMIDTDEMFDILGKMKQGADKISSYQKNKNMTDIEKAEAKNRMQTAMIKSYKDAYTTMLTDVLNQRLGQNTKERFNSDKSIGQMFGDFETMMNKLLYKETTTARTIAMSQIAFGGMNEKEIYDLPNQLNLKTTTSEILKSFEGKSTYQINKDVRKDYLFGFYLDYEDNLAMAQAVKQRNDARGFWGKFFHPIDNRREKNLLADLCKKMKRVYPDRNVEKDLENKKPLNSYASAERDSLSEIYNDFEDMNLNIEVYNHDKTADLSKEFPTRFLAPEEARHRAEEKYKKEIYPKFQQAYEKGEDLSSVRGDMTPVDFAGYKNRFLHDKEEEKAELDYKQNIYPKFKSAFEKNGGDLSSLEKDYPEDFQVMQVKFMQDYRQELVENNQPTDILDENFQDIVKGSVDENLKINNEVKIKEIVNSEPVVENDEPVNVK